MISLNDSTLSMNFGAFHAGVEIDGVEVREGVGRRGRRRASRNVSPNTNAARM